MNWELNAAGNVNFDMGRYGIEFVASPRHADGIVITGPISKNMAEPLQMTYDATPSPKIIILAGTDAISGGIFAESPAIDRRFIEKNHIDLYIPGNPVHRIGIYKRRLLIYWGYNPTKSTHQLADLSTIFTNRAFAAWAWALTAVSTLLPVRPSLILMHRTILYSYRPTL